MGVGRELSCSAVLIKLYMIEHFGGEKKREKEKKCCVKLVTGCLGSEELALTKEYT